MASNTTTRNTTASNTNELKHIREFLLLVATELGLELQYYDLVYEHEQPTTEESRNEIN